ncbi:hypothetical protein BKA70DRAFT_177443 [Coprinopsis sp. MPI-PUGE-AT-0042]|nr:hypothetical protein BKA70DRAFT_177443 [Coprinopsis sp. MPI-PUGE-AT-0042]
MPCFWLCCLHYCLVLHTSFLILLPQMLEEPSLACGSSPSFFFLDDIYPDPHLCAPRSKSIPLWLSFEGFLHLINRCLSSSIGNCSFTLSSLQATLSLSFTTGGGHRRFVG